MTNQGEREDEAGAEETAAVNLYLMNKYLNQPGEIRQALIDTWHAAWIARGATTNALWTCPACAFTFDRAHEDESGGFSCPSCAEARLTKQVAALTATVEALEGEIEAAAAEACDYCRHKCELHRGEYGWLHTYNAISVDCGAESIHQRAWARTQREAGR